MVKRIVRLTENDLTRLVRRIIMEQDIDVKSLNDNLNAELKDATSTFFMGKDIIQYMITNISGKFELYDTPRMVSITAKKGRLADGGGFNPSVDNIDFTIIYKCKTSSIPEKDLPITREAEFVSMKNIDSFKSGITHHGTLSKGLVDSIEANWCKKLPPIMHQAQPEDEPSPQNVKQGHKYL